MILIYYLISALGEAWDSGLKSHMDSQQAANFHKDSEVRTLSNFFQGQTDMDPILLA